VRIYAHDQFVTGVLMRIRLADGGVEVVAPGTRPGFCCAATR
jgi:hypothetical protein